ncbi:hypothetical protein A0128_03860 [Leptospira tipperaryensis]|uniref:Type I restriction modification DNA specificity domain-containing protein n=1 Tax=Leptospira tipperaryensis TaxID=2564040 RepID=A0A1D7UU30_9LEPT|nr:restriction endonuclease subunit S [Leptospira tipperaryensis]AOP33068.1 hypothetical protein A0128_03860 [Leptospira tipperaryensis]
MEMKQGYKQTEVGVIPEDWEVKRIGEIFNISAGGDLDMSTLSTFKDSFFNYPIFSNSLSDKGLYGYTSNPQYESNTVTVTARGTVGYAVFRNHQYSAIGRVLILSPIFKINGKFTEEYINNYIKFANESTGVPQLTVPQIAKYHLILPPTLTEQEAIANVLSDMDALILSLEKLISKKQQIKQGTMQALLTGRKRLPGFGKGERTKLTEVGLIPEDWEVKRIGETALLKARIGWHGLTAKEYLNTGIYRLITGTEFHKGSIDWSRCFFVDQERYEQDKYIQIKENDILITKDGSIGKIAFVNLLNWPATLNSGVFVIRPKNISFFPNFLFYIFSSFYFDKFISQITAGSTILHLYQKDFVKFTFPLPPTLAEQTAIANVLSDLDSEIDALESKLEKYKLLKQGMMQQLLTGAIRLV